MDPIIATKVNDGLKQCVTTLAKAATEASSPQIRQALARACQDAIQRQQELAQLMEQRGWYRPPQARAEDIQHILPQLQALEASAHQPAGVH